MENLKTISKAKWIKLFLRVTIATAFLSAVVDRFGVWPKEYAFWGNWQAFTEYTAVLIPWVSDSMVKVFAVAATTLEILFALLLLVGFRTELVAQLSGFLLLSFALTMGINLGIKAPFDYSVFTAAAAAFALSTMRYKFLEMDQFFSNDQAKSIQF